MPVAEVSAVVWLAGRVVSVDAAVEEPPLLTAAVRVLGMPFSATPIRTKLSMGMAMVNRESVHAWFRPFQTVTKVSGASRPRQTAVFVMNLPLSAHRQVFISWELEPVH